MAQHATLELEVPLPSRGASALDTGTRVLSGERTLQAPLHPSLSCAWQVHVWGQVHAWGPVTRRALTSGVSKSDLARASASSLLDSPSSSSMAFSNTPNTSSAWREAALDRPSGVMRNACEVSNTSSLHLLQLIARGT